MKRQQGAEERAEKELWPRFEMCLNARYVFIYFASFFTVPNDILLLDTSMELKSTFFFYQHQATTSRPRPPKKMAEEMSSSTSLGPRFFFFHFLILFSLLTHYHHPLAPKRDGGGSFFVLISSPWPKQRFTLFGPYTSIGKYYIIYLALL